MKIGYWSSRYQSHLRMSRVYRALLALRHELLSEADWPRADFVVLHDEPNVYPDIYAAHPELHRKYVVGYAVWETTTLPDSYRHGIDLVQEIWTCSDYCRAAFAASHARVAVVPHAIERDTTCSEEDLAFVRQAIGYEPERTYVTTITKARDPRKNTAQLVEAFGRISADLPDARLVVKYPGRDGPSARPPRHVHIVCQRFTEAQMNAFYQLTGIYVSAHHSEGWGLTMSDAMAAGRPVIATGYSGNLEFMTPENSCLVDAAEQPIRPEDCRFLFDSTMRWGYVRTDDLERHLRWTCAPHNSDALAAKVRQASSDIRRFSLEAVNDRLTVLTDAVASRLS